MVAVGDVMSQLTLWQMVGPGADHAQMAALLDRVDSAAGVNAVYTVGALSVLAGVLLLSIGLIRGRRAPAWAAVGLTVATVVNIAGFSAGSNAVVALSWALLLLSMGAVAREGAGLTLPRPVIA
jgi:FtsH-binding integral membrane protein